MSEHLYEGMDEYRWEFPHVGQGHYFLADNLDEAARQAVAEAKRINLGNTIVLQKWKPKRGLKIIIFVQNQKLSWR